MTKNFDAKFKEMIIQKYKSGVKVAKLSKDFDVSRATIYTWINSTSSENITSKTDEINYEKEYRKAMKKMNEMSGEMEALKKCIAIFSKK